MHRGSGNIKQRKVFIPLARGVAFTVKTIAAIAKGINVDAYLFIRLLIPLALGAVV